MKPLTPLRASLRIDPKLAAAAEQIRGGLGSRILSASFQSGDVFCFEVDRQQLLSTALYLRDNPQLRFEFLSCLSGVDMVSHLTVVYHLHSLQNHFSCQLTVKLDAKDSAVESVASIWPTANWHEREAFDMLGIQFMGHPNLERLLLAEDFEGFPLRRDYSLRRSRCPLGGHVGRGGQCDE